MKRVTCEVEYHNWYGKQKRCKNLAERQCACCNDLICSEHATTYGYVESDSVCPSCYRLLDNHTIQQAREIARRLRSGNKQ